MKKKYDVEIEILYFYSKLKSNPNPYLYVCSFLISNIEIEIFPEPEEWLNVNNIMKAKAIGVKIVLLIIYSKGELKNIMNDLLYY